MNRSEVGDKRLLVFLVGWVLLLILIRVTTVPKKCECVCDDAHHDEVLKGEK